MSSFRVLLKIFTIITIICIKSSYQTFSQNKNNLHMKNKRNYRPDYSYNNRIHVDAAAYTFLCGSDNVCQKIVEYVITETDRNCNEVFIPIIFEVVDNRDNKTVEINGFLPENGNLISLSQEYSNICRKIRRYQLSLTNLIFFL